MLSPLQGIRVLGLEQYMSAPYCTMLLADAGAEVIKIERPGSGDPRRSIPPFARGEGGAQKAGGFMAYNRNKKSLALNLRSPEGRDVFRELAAQSDVVVENLRPGASAKLGFDYEDIKELNPRLVYAAISGFGRMPGFSGPYSDRPAFDIVAEAMSGMMNLVGFEDKPPAWTIYGLADVYSGMCTAYGIMLALFMREKTGAGQFVDSAILDNMLALNERMVALYSVTGHSPQRGRLRHLFPRGAFRCSDGYLALNVPDDTVWKRLCTAMGRDDLIADARSASGTARAEHANELQPIIEIWLQDKTRAQAGDLLNASGVPAGPVYSAEDVFADAHVAARKMLQPVQDPEVGEYRFARSPVLLSAVHQHEAAPAPALGEHTREILGDVLGYPMERIAALEQQQVVQSVAA